MIDVIVPASAVGLVGLVMRRPVIMAAVTVLRRDSRFSVVLCAAKRMRHCHQPLERNQQQQREKHEFSKSARHFRKSRAYG
jgi:hypothetical protein